MQRLIKQRPCNYCGAQIGELCRSLKTGVPIMAIGQVHDVRLTTTPLKRTTFNQLRMYF